FGLVAVYHSTDGGQSWRKTWRADSGRAPERLIGTAIATRHGLFVTGMDAAGKVGWRSHDHGRTYRRPNPDDELGRAGRVRGGYLVTDDNTGRWYRSADGVSWEPLALPPAS
ncbi:MAG: hypothetical protein ACRDQF_18160, partial [Thermocrispum sp.]